MKKQTPTEKEQDMPEVNETPTACPKCHAEVLDTFSYQCGSIRPNYVVPSFAQSEQCKIRILQSTVATLRKALEYIADPIGDAKRKVKESHGELKLDVGWAIALSESASHLREVARKALEETK